MRCESWRWRWAPDRLGAACWPLRSACDTVSQPFPNIMTCCSTTHGLLILLLDAALPRGADSSIVAPPAMGTQIPTRSWSS